MKMKLNIGYTPDATKVLKGSRKLASWQLKGEMLGTEKEAEQAVLTGKAFSEREQTVNYE